MSLTIHNHPQKASYLDPSEWPFITGQDHWNGDTTSGMPPAHIHIEGHFPVWAELPATVGPIILPFTLKLFHLEGALAFVDAALSTGLEAGPSYVQVDLDAPLPFVGDPMGLVSMTGRVTFDPAVVPNLPKRGWIGLRLRTRAGFTMGGAPTGVTLTAALMLPFYSLLDPTLPDPPLTESGINIGIHAEIENPADLRPGGNVFGEHLSEVRDYLPTLAPFSTPQTVKSFTYAYGPEHTLPAGVYELRLDPDLHHGIPGQLLATSSTAIPGGTINTDVLDPVVIAASVPPPLLNLPPGVHRLFFNWIQSTGVGNPGIFAPNEQLTSLLGIEVTIGPNPQPVPPVTVPNVVGLLEGAALSDLSAAGLVEGPRTVVTNVLPATQVLAQDPAAGTSLPRGSAVALTLSSGSGGPPPPPPPPAPTWQPSPLPIVGEQLLPGTDRFRVRIGDKTIELTQPQ